MNNLIETINLSKSFPLREGFLNRGRLKVHAVRGVSIAVKKGETLGLVGESGCGKSTLAQLVIRLIEPDDGRIFFEGRDITHLGEGTLKPLRRHMQMVFQDPYSSLNPRMTVGDIIAEPLFIHKEGDRASRRERVMELLGLVGLPRNAFQKYPHEFSGGQRQRVSIARAVALHPSLVVADEPVSALDSSIRGEILNLLSDLRDRFGLSYLFISHDLKVVEHISHRIAVMYLGELMEMFPSENMKEARHPYTQALVSAAPVPKPGRQSRPIDLKGDVPSPISPPGGCSFHPRCPYAGADCADKKPEFREYMPGFSAACHYIDKMGEKCVGRFM